MKFNFDEKVNRFGTMSYKWEMTGDHEVLPLWVADMDFRTAPAIIEALRRRVDHGIFGYTRPNDEYYDAINSWFTRRHGWSIRREDVIYTIGVVAALSTTIKALTKPGDGVILMTPVYNCFFTCVSNNDCRLIQSPLVRTENSYVIDYDNLEECCKEAKVLVLCNPHNPCGRVWTVDELRRVDEICARHNVTIISDEIHCEMVYGHHRYTPFATVATRPCVVCCSPSKAFNTAGLQTANIVASDPEMHAAIDKAINVNEVCDVGPMGVTALIAAYNEGEEWLDAATAYIYENYKYLVERLSAMPGNLKALDLQGTYLAWVDVRSLDIPVAWLSDALIHEAKVRFTPGTEYGVDGEGYLRVNLACPRSTLSEALDRLENWLRNR